MQDCFASLLSSLTLLAYCQVRPRSYPSFSILSCLVSSRTPYTHHPPANTRRATSNTHLAPATHINYYASYSNFSLSFLLPLHAQTHKALLAQNFNADLQVEHLTWVCCGTLTSRVNVDGDAYGWEEYVHGLSAWIGVWSGSRGAVTLSQQGNGLRLPSPNSA